ncbi:anti-sigma factor [Micromonospora sp. NPDC000089]|uniref:anti-sigma factor n=1 Tax=unclassified Micromonospora TaxID=2617518 RepID=UPI0036810F34
MIKEPEVPDIFRNALRYAQALQHDGWETVLRQQAVWESVPAELEATVMRQLVGTKPADNVVPLRRRLFRREASAGRPAMAPRRRLGLVAAAAVTVALASAAGASALTSGESSTPMRLTGTALGGSSHAEVRLRSTMSGVEIKADFDGLPPAPVGSYYEGWVVGPRGAVAIGTFHLRHGTRDVVLWSGVELKDYPTMTVTLQQEGGGAQSSGKVVLRGPVPETFE